MVISQGEVWWIDFPVPIDSGVGYRRPAVVIQGDLLNRSRIRTVLCVPLSSNTKLAEAPGNVLLPARSTQLPKDSAAVVSQMTGVDRQRFLEPIGKISDRQVFQIFVGLDIVLGR
jgi:mRNA interferase MazF